MTNPIPEKPRVVVKPEPICGKGTRNGAAAESSRFQFSPCVLPEHHIGPCDSGPAPEPPKAA
jgi:hypothetical protein